MHIYDAKKLLKIAQIFCAALIPGLFATTPGEAKNRCTEARVEAERLYISGNLDKVIKLLEPCSGNVQMSKKERVEIHRLLAITYLATDHFERAERAVIDLLALIPSFEPTLRDPPQFAKMVEIARLEASSNLVTSVSKNSENLLKAPATVIAIGAEEILRRGYLDLEALFHDLPGFDISRGNGVLYSTLYHRGYRANGTDRTLFLVDGVEENDLWTNFANVSRQYPLSNIKKVEVVYGPASTMYGPNAYVGVVNIITKKPEEVLAKGASASLRIQTGIGTWNTRYADLTLAGRRKGLSFSLTGRIFTSDEMDLSDYEAWDFRPNTPAFYKNKLAINGVADNGTYRAQDFLDQHGLENHAYFTAIRNEDGLATAIEITQAGALSAADLDSAALATGDGGRPITFENRTNDWLLDGKLRFGDLSLGLLTWRRKEWATGWFTDNTEAPAPWIPRHVFFYAQYDRAFGDDLLLSFFNRFKSHSVDEANTIFVFKSYASTSGGLELEDLLTGTAAHYDRLFFYRMSKELRSELKAVYSPAANFNLLSGVEVRNSLIPGNYVVSTQSNPSETGNHRPIDGGNHFVSRDYGIYSQAAYQVRENLRLTLGGRVDNNQSRATGGYGTVFNSRLAAVYTPADYVFKIIYAEAFKAASNWAKFSSTPTRIANPKLQPETVKNIDLSASRQFANKLVVNAVLYYAAYSDVVGQTQVVLEDGTTTTRNQAIGALRIRGTQAEIRYKGIKYSAYGNYTYTHPVNVEPRDEKGKLLVDERGAPREVRIGDIASHRFNLGLNALFVQRLNVNLRLNHVGKRRTGIATTVRANPLNHIEAYTVLNAAITYRKLASGLDVQMTVNNLLDREYFHPGLQVASGDHLATRIPQNRRNIALRLLFVL